MRDNLKIMLNSEWIPAAAALAILAARYAWVVIFSHDSKQSIEIRQEWVRRMLSQPGLEIVAAQTLRNSIMAATLMATTATLALLGVLTLGHAQMESVAGAHSTGLFDFLNRAVQVKMFLPVSLLAACVVLFSKTVRLYHRVGYTLGLPLGTSSLHGLALTTATFELARAATFYRTGWRALYGAFATGAWLVSGWMMLVATVIIVIVDIAAKIE